MIVTSAWNAAYVFWLAFLSGHLTRHSFQLGAPQASSRNSPGGILGPTCQVDDGPKSPTDASPRVPMSAGFISPGTWHTGDNSTTNSRIWSLILPISNARFPKKGRSAADDFWRAPSEHMESV